MASLFIKDDETADVVTRVAQRAKMTKTQLVREAVLRFEAQMDAPKPAENWLEWIAERRRTHPLPPPTGLKADKAFFDAMWDEL